MPELPEVETTCKGVSRILNSKTVTGGIIHERRLRYEVETNLPDKLLGKTLYEIKRRGKYIIMFFDGGSLIIHLGMSGSLRVLSTNKEKRKHDHIELFFGKLVLRFHDPRRFGSFTWTDHSPYEHKLLKSLGVEPLEKCFDGAYLYRETRNRRGNIKSLIMNARIVVGVGNIYANESLFEAGIHPHRQANRISLKRYSSLAQKIKDVLRDSILSGGTTLRDFYDKDGNPGYFKTKLKVYGKEGQPCSACARPIKHIVTGQRATYYCSHCQR